MWSLRAADLKLLHARSVGALKCVRVCRVNVNEPRDLVRVRCCDGAQFGAGDGMTDDHRPLQFQGTNDREYIVAKTTEGVGRRRETRGTKPASRDAVHVMIGRELRRKLVKYVRGVPAAGQEDD